MDGIINENELTVVKEYEIKNPLIQNIDSIINECYKDCHHKYFHTFEYVCVYDLNFTNDNKNETVNFTICDKSLGIFELNKKLTLARERGFKFNQINKLTIKIYSNLSYINIRYYLKLRIPIMHRRLLIKLALNRDYIQNYCNNLNNPIQFGFYQWYKYNNPGMLI